MKIPRSLRLCACHELGSNQRFRYAMHRLDFNLSDRHFGDPVPKMVLRGGFVSFLLPHLPLPLYVKHLLPSLFGYYDALSFGTILISPSGVRKIPPPKKSTGEPPGTMTIILTRRFHFSRRDIKLGTLKCFHCPGKRGINNSSFKRAYEKDGKCLSKDRSKSSFYTLNKTSGRRGTDGIPSFFERSFPLLSRIGRSTKDKIKSQIA